MNYARNGGRPQRLAECRGLAPLARRHALVSTEARSALPVDIPNWCPWPDSQRHCRRFELRASALGYPGCLRRATSGAHGRICTDTVRVLSVLSLRWATWADRAGQLVPRRICTLNLPVLSGAPLLVGLTRRESEDPGTPELARPATVRSFRRSGVKCSSSPDACRRGRTGWKQPANC